MRKLAKPAHFVKLASQKIQNRIDRETAKKKLCKNTATAPEFRISLSSASWNVSSYWPGGIRWHRVNTQSL